jgi:hypothetical protein
VLGVQRFGMLVVIVNHNCNANAVALRRGFQPLAPVKLIDSGSRLEPEECRHFDDLLPNVYYSGLLNRACEHAAELNDEAPLLLICSDVTVTDPARLITLLRDTFLGNAKVQIWAPSASGEGAGYQHMVRKADKPRRVSHVDGYCFAVRCGLLRRVCPIDVRLNSLGWGVDRHLGYLIAVSGGCAVVDDRIEVMHPLGAGYDTGEAQRQYAAWRKPMTLSARFFHFWGGRGRRTEGLRRSVVEYATIAIHRVTSP